MKDQWTLLKKCINNDIPAVVFQGDDKCVAEILIAAGDIYKKNGCSKEFLYDWNLLINEVQSYQEEFPAKVKIPKLLPSEVELIKMDIKRELLDEPPTIKLEELDKKRKEQHDRS